MTAQLSPDIAEQDNRDLIDDVVPTRGYDLVPVVGLGGSAGSIEALQQFFSAMPPDSGLAFVVVIHLSAEHESILAELIQNRTSMRVMQVQQNEQVLPDVVYVIPPRKALRTLNGEIQLSDLERPQGNHMAVDIFFRTLADTHGPHSAAVVLSGMDGDGAIGIKRIKERGGLTIAQDPEEASSGGMPHAAIHTGMVDWVLPVQDIPARLQTYFGLEKQLKLPPEEGPGHAPQAPPETAGDERAATGDPADETALHDVLTFLRTRTGRDLSMYKRATLLRRIARRMQVNGTDQLNGYLVCLRTRPGEADALLQDILISVTNFFRDSECFDALDRHIPSLFEGKGPNDTLRVWVVACATGEEAYSVAMALSEHARTLEAPPLIQVFATDLSSEAIQAARTAMYPSTIETDVSEERLRRYFVKEPGGYRVRRELREMVLFAMHDVLKDSPFSRLDMVTCRNLLIYLSRDAQARMLDIFHFSLVPGGKLFLGASESIDDGSPLFKVLDKKNRIYQQLPTARSALPVPTGASLMGLALDARPALRDGPVYAGRAFHMPNASLTPRPPAGRSSMSELHLKLLERIAPPSILVDREYDILHVSAGASRFLQVGAGEPTRNLLRMVHPDLRIELRAALFEASQTRQVVDVPAVAMGIGNEAVSISIRVDPAHDLGSDLFLVMLELQGPRPASEPGEAVERADNDSVARHLDRELERLKTHLRETVEQFEGSTEELKASNEELQAMNEELRSATEELETSREELQSINEEVTTVNHELKGKVDELSTANSDMHNLMNSTAIATVFLDRELRITRFTPTAVNLFHLIPSDLGRPLTDLTTQLAYPELTRDAQRVLERLVPIETEVGQSDGSWYLARLLPYRTVDDRIAGVVLSFIDITERKQAEEMRLWLAAVMNATADAIISFSLDYTILSWNNAAERIFGYSAAEAIGQPLRMLAGGPEQLINGGTPPVKHVQSLWRRKDGGPVDVSLTVSPINDGSGRTMAGTAIVRDISAETAMQDALQLANDKDNVLARVSAQLRLPLMLMVQSAERLREPELDAEQREEAIASIHEQAGMVSVLLANLLASRS